MTSERIRQLSQSNIGKDPEKIKERVRATWSSLSKSQRKEVLELAGITKFTVERTYKNGNISAKLVAALSHTQKINPLYFTGESDDSTGYSASALSRFISSKAKKNVKSSAQTYADFVETKKTSNTDNQNETPDKPPVSGRGRRRSAAQQASYENDHSLAKLLAMVHEANEELDKITDEEYVLLLRGMLLRSKFNPAADDVLRLIKFFLAY